MRTLLPRPAFIWIGVLLSLAISQTAQSKPNFIVVFCDNLGYGDIEPFGSTVNRTPNLNRMAKEGRKFTHFCVTAGVCTPSRSSIMTGCYSQRVGMNYNDRDGWVLRPVSRFGLNPDEVTIAEVLKDAGYATAIIGKWHLGDQPEFLPTRQGFDWFFGVPYSDDMTARTWRDGSVWPPLPLMENETVIESPCDRDGLTKRYTEKAMEWIAEHKDEPFFLYFPQAMPGSTKTPFASPAFKGKSKNGPWGDAIEELDWSMGVMLDQLQELGIAENTFVIWTSDNGAPISRTPGDTSRGSNQPLRGRGYSTAEGAFRVPTIVWQPGKVPGGTVCTELATTMDLLPTFGKLAGADLPKTNPIDGHDIAPLLFGDPEAKTPYEAFYYYDQKQLQAVRSGPWKLFLPLKQFSRHPYFTKNKPVQPLLFDLIKDIGSQHNVAADHPDIVAKLTKYAQRARQELGDGEQRGSGQRELGEIKQGTEPQPQLMQKNALQVIESARGGRHWVDAETAPPRTPPESLAALKIEPGFEISLFAAEPLVRDPVSIAFDANGDMFVAEYSDYPIGPVDGGDPLSKIVMLKDTDGDGKADQRYVFADKLDFAHSMMAYQDGLLVGAKTKILYLKDTDGDHVADVSETLFDGFKPAHAQMQIGNPRWGLDNWVHMNYGPGEVRATRKPDVVTKLPRKDFRFHPGTMEFESDSGMGQFGNTIDRWGRRFYCTNRNPIMTTFLTPAILARNPYHILPKAHYDVGKSGGDTRVYPLVSMKSNYLSHAGTHTSACGTTAYNGDLQNAKRNFDSSVFVCEPIGHVVTRSIVKSDGLRLTTQRAAEKSDFIASTDTWFRPASLATGPDGSLFLADMHRLWVEHPNFLPPEISAKLDWRAGEDRGRIYRIVPTGAKPIPYQAPQSTSDAVEMLTSKNAWKQFVGQRLLVEKSLLSEKRFDKVADELRKLLSHENSTTRMHAMRTLEGCSQLTGADMRLILDSWDGPERIEALKVAAQWLDDPTVTDRVCKLADDSDVNIRFHVALALFANDSDQATKTLCKLALSDGENSSFVDGLLTSTRTRSGTILKSLVESQEFLDGASAARIDLLKRAASVVGARGDIDELNQTLRLISSDWAGDWWRSAIISGLGAGLPRYKGKLGRLTLTSLLSKPPAALAESCRGVKTWFDQNQQIATDSDRSITDRTAAVELLAYQSFAKASTALAELLSTEQPVQLQTASIQALTKNGSAEAAKIVLDRWPELGPAVRPIGLDMLLRKTETTRLALAAMAKKQMNPSALSINQRARLLKHSDNALRLQAEKLFGGAVSTNRQKVAKDYERALTLVADGANGHKVFKRVCAACHRVDGEGHDAGPDLSDLRNRSKPAILYDILDPNSKVEPRFTSYSILTVDGEVFNGLVVSETSDAVVLKMAEGKQATIGRAEIERLKVSDVSLMPEGIEKDITPQQMADLLGYLKNRN